MSATDASRERVCALYLDHHGWLHDWLRRHLDGARDAADIAREAWSRIILLSNRTSLADLVEGLSRYRHGQRCA